MWTIPLYFTRTVQNVLVANFSVVLTIFCKHVCAYIDVLNRFDKSKGHIMCMSKFDYSC